MKTNTPPIGSHRCCESSSASALAFVVAALACMFSLIPSARAATDNWTGGASGNGTSWNSGTNWSTGTIPGSTDTAVFGASGIGTGSKVISLDASQTVYTLFFPAFGVTQSFTIGSASDITNGYTLTLTNFDRDGSNSGTQTIAANVILATDSTWNILTGFNGNISVTGNIGSGSAVAFTKDGNNTLTLNGNNTFTGSLRVLGGSLAIGGTNSYTGTTLLSGGSLAETVKTSTSVDDINSASTLVLGGLRGGGSFSITGFAASGAVNSQTFNGVTLNSGASSFSIADGASAGKTAVVLGAITRNVGGTVNFAQPTVNTTISASNGYTTTTGNDASGILGAWATVGGTDFAANNGTNIVAFTGYTDLTGATPNIVNGPTTNVRVSSGSSTGAIGLVSGTTTINTLLVRDTTARTLTVGAGNTLRFGASGGILTPASTGTFTLGAAGNAGTITAGGTDNGAGELIITNATTVLLNSVVADNGTGSVALTKSGAGTLTLGGTETYSGVTTVNAGTLNFSGSNGTNWLNTTGAINLTGGTLDLGSGNSQTTSGAVIIQGGALSGTTSTLVKSGANYDIRAGTISAKLSGTVGIDKTTDGILTFANTVSNTFTGTTTITEGSVIGGSVASVIAINGDLIVGNASGTGAPASYSNTGNNIAFNASKNLTIYSNGSVNMANGAQNLSGGTVNIIGGSLTGGQLYLFDNVNMTGGSFGGSTFGGNSTFNILASATSSVISAFMNLSYTFNVADGAAAYDLILSGNVAGSGKTITKSGSGTMFVSGANAATGNTTVNGGTVILANSLALANSALANGGQGIVFDSSVASHAFTIGGLGGAGNLALQDNAGTPNAVVLSLNVNASSLTYTGILSGSGGIIKTGTGTQILGGSSAETYTGATVVNSGILLDDFTSETVATDKINSASVLTLGGGTLQVKQKSGIATSQTFAGTVITPGVSSVVATSVGVNGLTVGLGAITRTSENPTLAIGSGGSGGVLSLTLPTTGNITTSNTNVNGILGTWATTGTGTGLSYVQVTGSNIGVSLGTQVTDASAMTDTSGTANYALDFFGGSAPATVNVNTIAYLGGADTTVTGATSFTVNGLMNAGTGLWTIGTNAITIGSQRELVIVTNGQSMTISSAIQDNGAGASGLTFSGSNGGSNGVLSLAGANTYTGDTTVLSGTLLLSNSLALQSSALNIIGGGIAFDSTVSSHAFNVGGLSGSGAIVLADNGANAITLTLNTAPGVTDTYSGLLSGSGGIVKTGSGTQYLTRTTNTYTGTTTISAGILNVAALAAIASNSSIGVAASGKLVLDGGTLQYTGTTATSTTAPYILTTNGGSFDASGSSAGTLTISGSAIVIGSTSGTQTLNLTGSGTGVLNGIVSDGSGGDITAITKTGTGSWNLGSTANTFSGGVTISNGTLMIGGVAASGSAQALGKNSTITLGGTNTAGTLTYTGGSGTFAQNVTVGAGNGVISNTGAGTLTVSGTLNKANTVLTFNTGVFNVTGQITGGDSSSFNSDLDITNATVTVSNANNNYTGPTYIYGSGTLLNGVSNALPAGTVLTTGSSSDGAVTNRYSLNGFNQTIAALNSVSSGSNTNIVSSGTGAVTNTLTLSGTNSDGAGVNGNFGGSLQNNGSGVLALTVLSGTQTLSGSSNYTGATAVSGGVLKITGALGNTSVTVGNAVASGLTPTLTGGIGSVGGSLFTPANTPARQVYASSSTTGNIAGTVTVSGTSASGSPGRLSPGNGGVGTLTVGALTLQGGSILNYEFNGSANDYTVVTGALTLNSGTVGINLFQESGTTMFTTNGTYDLFQYGSLVGSVGNLSVLNPNGGSTYTFGTTSVSGTNYVTLTIGGGGAASTTYTLATSAGSTNILTGGTTGITSVITNTGSGSADTLNYAGLGATSGAGGNVTGSSTAGGPLAQGASGTNSGQVFTGTSSGAVVITPAGSGTNATLNTVATQTGTSAVTVNVYDPASLGATQSGSTAVTLFATNASGAFRASAKVTADNGLSNNQGFTNVTVSNGTLINSGSSVSVAGFDKSGKLNGTYTATKNLVYDNVTGSGSAISGGSGNTANLGLTVTVSGNTAGAGQVFGATLFSGQKYGTTVGGTSSGYGLTSNISGDSHSPTTATLINGTASANTTVNMSFNTVPGAGPAHDNVFRTSDILSLSGIVATGSTGPDGSILTDTYVLQLTYDPSVSSAQYIGWYDATQAQWVNAVAGNSNASLPSAYFGDGEYVGSYASYLATLSGGHQTDLTFQLGTFGYDASTHTTWAVLDHNSEFAVIPEPGTWGMILGGFGMLIVFHKLRKRRVGI